MTVKELKTAIKDLPDDMEIILQKDPEGNGYSPLRGADPDCVYDEENTWSGIVYDIKNSAEDNGMEEDEWNELKTNPKVLVLHPIN